MAEVYYYDPHQEYKSFFDPIWYKIVVKNSLGDTLTSSRPINTVSVADRINAEIIRQHNLTLYGVNGNPPFYAARFACYKKQKYGEEFCQTRGYNGEVISGWSGIDQNTGMSDGYANPIIFNARWMSKTEVQQVKTAVGIKEDNDKQIWMSNHPALESGDILVESGTGKVFEVRSVSASEPNGVRVSQAASVSQIDGSLWEANNLFFPGEEP